VAETSASLPYSRIDPLTNACHSHRRCYMNDPAKSPIPVANPQFTCQTPARVSDGRRGSSSARQSPLLLVQPRRARNRAAIRVLAAARIGLATYSLWQFRTATIGAIEKCITWPRFGNSRLGRYPRRSSSNATMFLPCSKLKLGGVHAGGSTCTVFHFHRIKRSSTARGQRRQTSSTDLCPNRPMPWRSVDAVQTGTWGRARTFDD